MSSNSVKIPCVLHVDDDVDFLDISFLILRDKLKVENVTNPNEALKKINDNDYDLILTDYDMPEMNGLLLLDRIKVIKPDMPVIFYTGQGNEEIAREAFLRGASDYFTKDVGEFAHYEKLVYSIHKAIEIETAKVEKRESEKKYQSYINNSPNGIFVVDERGNFLEVNQAAAEFSGYPEVELLNMNIMDLVHPEHRERAMNNFRNMYVEGKHLGEYMMIKKDGSIIWMTVDAAKITPNRGIGFCRDVTERILKDQAIKKKDDLLEEAQRMGKIGHWEYNTETETLISSKEHQRILNLKPDEVTIEHIKRKIHPDDRETVRIEFNRCVNEGTPYNYEARIFPNENEMRHVNSRGEAIFNEEGKIVKLIGTVQDITERIKIRQELQKAERLFTYFMDNIDALVFMKDLEGNYTFMNRRAREVFGIDTKRFKKGPIDDNDIFSPQLAKMARENDRKVIDSGKSQMFEEGGFFGKDEIKNRFGIGNIYYYSLKFPYRDENGEIIGICGFSHDISEKKKIERELWESRESYKKLLEHGDIGMGFYDNHGKILMFNKKAAEYMGGKPEDFQGRNALEVFGPEIGKYIMDRIHRCIRNNKNYSYEDKAPLPTGTRWFITSYNPFRDDEGNIVGVQLFSSDITPLKKLEQDLVRKNRELTDFAYRVTHDLKEPCNIIKGFASILKDHPENYDRYVAKIEKQTDNIINFINRILELARAGKTINVKKEVNLEEVLKRSLQAVEKKDCSFDVNKDLKVIKLQGDPMSFNQIFINLIQNSVRYHNPENSSIKINVVSKVVNDVVVIDYEDNGLGIEPEYIDKIFNPGFTRHSDTGKGFGLAIIKKLVEAHKGQVEVTSPGKNKGTRFKLILPLHQDPAQE